jgi:MFS family permease
MPEGEGRVDEREGTAPRKGGRAGLRAFRNRNYRLFFGGQGLSLIGTWISRVATSWLVYRLTGSAAMLGVVGFAGQIPTFLLAPFAGVWVDRLDRHRVLVWTQVISMLQSFALAFLALWGHIAIWHVIALSAVQGVVNALDTPARQAFLVEMIDDREDLPNAIALNSSMFNGSRLVGPGIAGLMIAGVGEGWCFMVDGVSYLAVILSLLLMRVTKRVRPVTEKRVLQELAEGIRYAFGFAPIRSLLVLLALVSMLGMPYSVLMPVIAAQTLHGGPHTLGFLMAASGVGALAGALYLASRNSIVGLGRVIPICGAAFGVALVGLGLSTNLALSLALMLFTGGGFMVQMASSNTIIQTIVRDDMRGRVMAFYTMAFLGTAPIGSLIAGFLAERIGTARTLMLGGASCVVATLFFARGLPALREAVRPIYRERGILPPLARGIGETAALREEMER